MNTMTPQELYELLNSAKFRKTEEGDLFYNFYIYQYPADKEYEMRDQIMEFKENLIRPTTYVDALVIDLFEEFCSFLDQRKFLRHPSMLHYLADKEDADATTSNSVRDTLVRQAHSKEFLEYLHAKIMDHITIVDEFDRPYIFLHGIGSMYPYLRVNELLSMYEDYNLTHKYKLLVFYPGKRDHNSFSLFGMLPDHNTYRAKVLNNELS